MSDVCFGLFWATRNMSSIFEALHLVQHSAATTLLEHENHRKARHLRKFDERNPNQKRLSIFCSCGKGGKYDTAHYLYIHMKGTLVGVGCFTTVGGNSLGLVWHYLSLEPKLGNRNLGSEVLKEGVAL